MIYYYLLHREITHSKIRRVDFDALDHLSLMRIIKGKAEPATTRIKSLLKLLSSYSFNLYYNKGNDMI